MTTHYPAASFSLVVRRHTLSVVVDNEPGVLARIAGLFSGRGYNIESLTVTETEHEKHISRITVVTSGNEKVVEQIKAQLARMVPVHRVVDLTVDVKEGVLERELCLVKVAGKGDHRVEALRLASAFGAKTLDASLTSFIFELTGSTEEVERFITIMTSVGLVEVSRTGIAAMGRGPDAV
jgi:acetolactate synthase-1/3 small subunit